MGVGSSNLNAVFFEVDDVLTKDKMNENTLEIVNPGYKDASGIDGCGLYGIDKGGDVEPGPWKYKGSSVRLELGQYQTNGNCSDKIFDTEKYFSSCFLVPKKHKIKDSDGKDISDKCKLVYKAHIECDDDNDVVNPCKGVKELPPGEEGGDKYKCKHDNVIINNKKWNCVYRKKDNTCNACNLEIIDMDNEKINESFVNKNDDNNTQCIIIAIILLIVFLYLKRKN